MTTETLLLRDSQEPWQLTTHANHRWTRFAARIQADSLDRQLARGRSPESGWLLAARAYQLVTPANRHGVALAWSQVLTQARRPPVMRNPRVRMNQAAIIAGDREIHELIDTLLAARPTPARGMAMATVLLTDGTGPLYNPRRATDLGSAITHAIAELDPTSPLIPV